MYRRIVLFSLISISFCQIDPNSVGNAIKAGGLLGALKNQNIEDLFRNPCQTFQTLGKAQASNQLGNAANAGLSGNFQGALASGVQAAKTRQEAEQNERNCNNILAPLLGSGGTNSNSNTGNSGNSGGNTGNTGTNNNKGNKNNGSNGGNNGNAGNNNNKGNNGNNGNNSNNGNGNTGTSTDSSGGLLAALKPKPNGAPNNVNPLSALTGNANTGANLNTFNP